MQERWEGALDLVFELSLLVGEDARKGLEREGLTPSRGHLLLILAEVGPCSQRTLADRIGVTPRTITALVDGLEATGFVTRESDPGDRRARRVTMTRRGRTASRRMLAGRRRLARALFGDVSPQALEAFDAELRDVIARLRELLGAPKRAA